MEDITPICGNCGSGAVEARLGGKDDRYELRTDWIINYSNVPGWYCNECGSWSPDPKCVDERGEPTIRRDNTGPRSHKDIVEEAYYKYANTQSILGGPCRSCNDIGITKLNPLKVCPSCEGKPNSLNHLGKFLVDMLIKALRVERGKQHQQPQKERVVRQPTPLAYYYGVLGLQEHASKDEVQKAYHVMSKAFHPDNKDTGDPERFRLIHQAKEKLIGK